MEQGRSILAGRLVLGSALAVVAALAASAIAPAASIAASTPSASGAKASKHKKRGGGKSRRKSARATRAERLPSGIPPPALRAEPSLPAPSGWPFGEEFPRTSGTGRFAGGAYLWSDFIHDDHGATGRWTEPSIGRLTPREGTYTYPDGSARMNGADIFRVAVGLDRRATYWRVDWTTLVDRSVPIAAFALDTDDSTETGTATWPAGVGLRSAGTDWVLLVSGTRAFLLDAASGERTPIEDLGGKLRVDMNARSFVVRLPRRALAPGGVWRIRVASGLASADGDGFEPVPESRGAEAGQPPVYNVGFRNHFQEKQLGNFWMEDAQAAALTSGEVGEFNARLRWRDLSRRRSTREPLVRGYSNRWYVSSIELGQGAVRDENLTGDLRPNFLGRVQPYAVYVPTSYSAKRKHRLVWLLHSLDLQHNQFGGYNPRLIRQMCEERRAICTTPLGRGPDGWYIYEAELDFFEVWGRLADAYHLDPDRSVVSGYSMGGYAAYRLGLGFPDLFSHAASLAGPPSIGARAARDAGGEADGDRARDGDMTPLVGNGRWLPYYVAHGAADQLVPFTSVVEQVEEFDRLGQRYRFDFYPGEDHVLYATQDRFTDMVESIGEEPRVRRPGEVSFSWYPNLSRSDLGIGPTGAWWVRAPLARRIKPGTLAQIRAGSSALPSRTVTSRRSMQPMVATDGEDAPTTGWGSVLTQLGSVGGEVPKLLGATIEDLAAAGDPAVAVRTERTWSLGDRAKRIPQIDLDLRNVAELTIDTRWAGRRRREALEIDVSTDGPSLVKLARLESGTLVTAGEGRIRADRKGRATVSLRGGGLTIRTTPPRR